MNNIIVIAFNGNFYARMPPVLENAYILISALNEAMGDIPPKYRKRASILFDFLSTDDAHGAEPFINGLEITISYPRQETMKERLNRYTSTIKNGTGNEDIKRKCKKLEHRLSENDKRIARALAKKTR